LGERVGSADYRRVKVIGCVFGKKCYNTYRSLGFRADKRRIQIDMSNEDTKAKDAAMELAEEARDSDWQFPSFTAEMFRGDFRWDLMHPYPVQDEADKKIGDELIATIRDVLEAHVDPVEIDRTGEYPQEALKALADIGLFGMKISKEYGGLGLSITNYARALGFMASYCQSTVTWISAHQSIGVPEPLKVFGTDEQKKKFLPRLAKGAVSAFALTEPEVGSDPAQMKTTAMPSQDGSHYILNGRKLWCTNGADAELVVVMAKTPPKVLDSGKEIPQISAFVVEMDSPGCSVKNRCDFMGLRGISNGELFFENVEVPAENLIGKPGMGLKIALTTLNTGRLGVPAAGTGALRNCLADARKWTTERVQWGKPVGEHQAISKKIANVAANAFAMQSMTFLTCSFADRKNADIRLEAAAAKYFCTETGWLALDDLLQVIGGRAFETASSIYKRGEYPYMVERALRDSRVGRIFEGSSEVMHLIMAREAMDTHFKLIMPIIMPRKKDKKTSMISRIMTAVKFYGGWYPKTWMPANTDFKVHKLSGANQDHLRFASRCSKKLARKLFHTMAVYGAKLEFEQLLLANYVEIGVDLFVMSAALANAESIMTRNPDDNTPNELADLFCKNARQRIAANFKAVKSNANKNYTQVARRLMDGDLEWMAFDTYGDLPPAYRDYEKNQTETNWGTEKKEEEEVAVK
jgi:alkylation response protein AidB-like acyl-CoA dehydrogenase